MDSMSIGQAAREIGVSTRALRLWEARGLIPRAERTASRYRVFSNADLGSMRFIRQAQLLGLTLDQIKRILDASQAGTMPCDEVRILIDRRVAHIDRAIAELSRERATLDAARQNGRSRAIVPDGSGVCQIIETAISHERTR